MTDQIVLLIGLVLGFWLAYINVANILMYMHMHKFLVGSDYGRFLSVMDGEEIFTLYGTTISNLGYKKYKQVILESAPVINSVFERAMSELRSFIIWRYTLFAIVPLIIYYEHALYMLYGLVSMHVIVFFYKFSHQTHRFPYLAILMNDFVIRKYLAEEQAKEVHDKAK